MEKNLPELLSMSIFCRGPYNSQIIHIDTVSNDGNYEKSYANFYIPIFNQEGKIVWYDPESGNEVNKLTASNVNSTNKETQVLTVNYKFPKVLFEYSDNDPVVINTLIPHRAISKRFPRAALSFRLMGNPNLFEILNI